MRENTVLHSFENHEKRRYADNYPQQHKTAKISIPWFIFIFVLAMVVNTYVALPAWFVSSMPSELSMNITPSDTAISFSFAFSTGPTAAMALPPQMAVPEDMR